MNDKTLKRFSFVFILLYLTVKAFGQVGDSAGEKLSLLFIGDIMGHDEQIWSAENRITHTFDYDTVFSYIKPVISAADIAIANFEVTLAGPPYQGYPQFSSPASLAVACRNAGIDYLVTANNHAVDRGREGIEETIRRLDSIGIPHTGTFINQSARDSLQPLIIKRKGISIALLNYTYGTNGLKVPFPVIVNTLSKELITSDIEKAKKLNPDFLILFLHWGTEYDTIPSATQSDLANYFFSRGVDLIIGSHPHVIQRMEWYKNNSELNGKAIVYSLGNFISNQRKSKTDGGSMVRIELMKDENTREISDAGFYLTWVYTPIVNYRKQFYILPCSEFETKPDFFANPSDYKQMKRFIIESRSLLYNQNINIPEILYHNSSWTSGK
jgi:poly-gamma-glutamate capsule biosynthesis protein CapA/YwtB (metallophosphatase superfamily)